MACILAVGDNNCLDQGSVVLAATDQLLTSVHAWLNQQMQLNMHRLSAAETSADRTIQS